MVYYLFYVCFSCLKYLWVFVCIFNYILDSYVYSSPHQSMVYIVASNNLSTYCNIFQRYETNGVLAIGCMIYCFINLLPGISSFCKRHGRKGIVKIISSRLFNSKSIFGKLINIYTIWLFMINILLLLLCIPNIINPGPNNFVNELNVIYHNVQGFVNLKTEALSTNKVLGFQGYIFTKQPDVIILNETWLKSSIQDSEIFPNNSYKVFRRDRSLKSHPFDVNKPKKYRLGGGGVAIAVRSDLDVDSSLLKSTVILL